jgi:hypothetical protein
VNRDKKDLIPLVTVHALTFPQNGHEISTCGNWLLMNFSDVLKSRKIKGISPEKFF